MIRVNLLPAEMESAPATQINPAIPVAICAILPLILITPYHLSQLAKKKQSERDVTSLQSQLERYQPIIAQVEALERAKAQLTQRKSIIQQLESERLRYPQFMDDFVKLLPGNLWLSSLTTTMMPASDVISITMAVTALDNYAIADLISNLETSQIFTDVDLGTISTTQSATGQSATFNITANYRKSAQVSADVNKKS